MIGREFDPGFRIRLHRKDLELAVEAAGQVGAPLPSAVLVHELMTAAVEAGLGDLDHSALRLLLDDPH